MTKPTINLSGPQGNAFALMGLAKRTAAQLGIDFTPIRQEMTSGDYDNLVAVFLKHFGQHFDITR